MVLMGQKMEYLFIDCGYILGIRRWAIRRKNVQNISLKLIFSVCPILMVPAERLSSQRNPTVCAYDPALRHSMLNVRLDSEMELEAFPPCVTQLENILMVVVLGSLILYCG